MRLLLSLIVCFHLCYMTHGQQSISLESVNQPDGSVDIVALHDGFYPVTVILSARLKNMTSSLKLPSQFVVHPHRDSAQLLCTLRPIDRKKRIRYAYEYKHIPGDILNAKHDDNYVYELPYAESATYQVIQGYNGSYSHQGQKSLDFDMKKGTPIYAARSGVVAMVEEKFSHGCPSPSCRDEANYVMVYHEDGTFAQYVHLKRNGAAVEPADRINRGDLIGYSGETGWCSGPHLHFDVFIFGEKKREYIATKFRTSEHNATYLEAGKAYKRPKPTREH